MRLASKLTGFSLTLIKEGAEDIDLSEFQDELGEDLLDILNESGIMSAVTSLILMSGLCSLLMRFPRINLLNSEELCLKSSKKKKPRKQLMK